MGDGGRGYAATDDTDLHGWVTKGGETRPRMTRIGTDESGEGNLPHDGQSYPWKSVQSVAA